MLFLVKLRVNYTIIVFLNAFVAIATETWPETPSIINGTTSRAMLSMEWDDDILGGSV